MAKVQITGGNFQDSEGNLLANGYLELELNQDESVGTSLIAAGLIVTVPLDSNGNVLGTVSVWPNDQLSPGNSYYTVTGYSTSGQLAWGPNQQQILSSPSPYNIGAWIPNQMQMWNPGVSNLVLQTNGILNGSQGKLNLESTDASITLVDDGAGNINMSAASVSGVVLKAPAADQTIEGEFNLIVSDGSFNVTGAGLIGPFSSTPSLLNLEPSGGTIPLAVGTGDGTYLIFSSDGSGGTIVQNLADGDSGGNKLIFRAHGGNIRFGSDSSHGLAVDTNGNVLIGGAGGGTSGCFIELDSLGGAVFDSNVLNGATAQLLGSNVHGDNVVFQFPNLTGDNATGASFILLCETTPPSSSSALGFTGMFARDTNFLYSCVATNTWARAPISVW